MNQYSPFQAVLRIAVVTLSMIVLVRVPTMAADVAIVDQIDRNLNWVPISASEKTSTLSMLSAQTEGNYSKIRTWEGEYSVELQERLNRAYVGKAFGGKLRPDQISALEQMSKFDFEFAIDVAADSIFSAKRTSTFEWVKAGSNKKVVVPDGVPTDNRSVLTADRYAHFSPNRTPTSYSVSDHPRARAKRAAYRDPPERAAGKEYGDLMDPRTFFGLHPSRPFWEELNLSTKALSGGFMRGSTQEAQKRVKMFKSESADGEWFALSLDFNASQGGGHNYMTSIWSPLAGFNPVSYVVSKDPEGKEPITTVSWKWKVVENTYLPAEVDHVRYADDGSKKYHRTATLKKVSINNPLDSDQFSYTSLGLAEGELVLDKVERAVYIMEGGEAVKLANFGDKFGSRSTMHSLLLYATVLSIFAIAGFFVRKTGVHRS